MRPLDRLPSIKLKLSILIVAAVAVSAAMSQIGYRYGWPVWLRPIVAACVSLVMVNFLAHGMTSPLREMARAAKQMARGDSTVRITASSKDEVGQLARAFNSMAGDLAELDAERRALVSNAAHELRTPIAGLHATMENLADGIIAPRPDVIDRLVEQTERLRLLVADLLDLSRLDAAGWSIVFEDIDVAAVVDTAVDVVRLDHPGIAIRQTVVGSPVAVGHADLIGRLVTNLLRNAVLHGAGREVETRVAQTVGGLEISVSDSGPGFGATQPDRLFDRFYRGDAEEPSGRPGSGLGLAICRAIAVQHGATITATSNEPTGAVFTVWLPSHPSLSAASPSAATPAARPSLAGSKQTGST